jgi:hypothetical protein
MSRSRRLALLAALGMLLGASLGRADIPPPFDSPDAHCSREEQCAHGALCPAGLRVDHDAATSCQSDAQGRGLVYRCHTGGNYMGTSLYCPPQEQGSWRPPASAGSAGSPGRSRWGCSVGGSPP